VCARTQCRKVAMRMCIVLLLILFLSHIEPFQVTCGVLVQVTNEFSFISDDSDTSSDTEDVKPVMYDFVPLWCR
jgi:hypothetical protein